MPERGGGNTYYKDPNATLDYTIDWSNWLCTEDTIQTSSWIVPSGITSTLETHTATTTTIWLAGGTVGIVYTVTNRVVTTAGRTDDRSLTITIEER